MPAPDRGTVALPPLPRQALVMLALALLVATGAFATAAVLARRTYQALDSGAATQQEAYDVLVALRLLRQHVGESRVGATGYLLSRDPLYRATYETGLGAISADTVRLGRLVRDRPVLRSHLDQLQPALVAYAAAVAAAVRIAGQPGAAHAIRGTRDAILLEDIRGHFAAMEAEQIRLMDASAGAVRRAVSNSNVIITWVTGFGVLVILATGLVIGSQLRARARLELQVQRGQRLEAVGRLAGGIAHDFNNILAAILGYADLLLMDASTGPVQRASIAEMRTAALRARDLTRQLLAFSRRQVLQLRVLDVNAVIRGLHGMLTRLLGEDIDVALALGEIHPVRADPGQLEQVIVNLVVNARDAMPEGGRLTIETRNIELDAAYARTHAAVTPGPHVLLAVSDTGVGMDEAVRAQVFEPFFTTKEHGSGTGLGLATVYGIVKQSGGSIWVYSEPGRGTTIKIYLPRAEGQATPGPTAPSPPAVVGGSETVLLVEDDEGVRRVVARLLETAGYTVLVASQAEEAVAHLDRHAGPVHLLISDVVLPNMSGPQLARDIASRVPGIRILFQSGYSDLAVARHGALAAGAAFLQKPYGGDDLLRKVREVLDGASGSSRPAAPPSNEPGAGTGLR